MNARRAFASIAFAGSLGVAFLCAPSAIAGAGDQEARAQFARGVSAYDAKDYAIALDAFRAAYAEKASPGIERNIALCLRAMHRNAEAVDTLEDMLARGGESLDAHTREAAQKAIDEMTASLATIRIRAILQTPDTPAGRSHAREVQLSVDDVDVPPEKRASVRLDPGDHTIRARANGFAEGLVRVSLNAGERDHLVDISLVAIVAPMSSDDPNDDPNDPNSDRAAPVLLPRPALYMPDVKPQAPVSTTLARRWYALGGITFGSEARTLGSGLGAGEGASRVFGGRAATLRIGWKLGRFFNIEGLGEIGTISPVTAVSGVDNLDVLTWALAPELRFHTLGKLRFITGVAVGIEGQRVTARLEDPARSVSAVGAGAIGLVEIGAQLELGRWILELDGLVDLHGVGSATTSEEKLTFIDSPASRAGVRLMLGYQF